MNVTAWTDAAIKAQHASGGVHPYLWDRRPEKPPIRSEVTTEFIRFCVWLEQQGIRSVADRASRASSFLRSRMLDNGAVPFEMNARTLTPVKECPYLSRDSMSATIAGQVCGDEELVGRSLDFLMWCYGQLPLGKFLPMWHNFEAPLSSMPSEWMHQPTCHQSFIANLELDEFVCSTWGDAVTDDIDGVLAVARSSVNGGLFDADRYRPEIPLLPHFLTCESFIRYLSESGDAEGLKLATDGIAVGIDALLGADGNGDSVLDGQLVGHMRPKLLATAARVSLVANTALEKEVVPRSHIEAMMGIVSASVFKEGFAKGLPPVSSDSEWEENTIVCVGTCMVATQVEAMLSRDGLGAEDIRILV